MITMLDSLLLNSKLKIACRWAMAIRVGEFTGYVEMKLNLPQPTLKGGTYAIVSTKTKFDNPLSAALNFGDIYGDTIVCGSYLFPLTKNGD